MGKKNVLGLYLHSMVQNPSLMSLKIIKILARMHYAVANQRELNLDWSPINTIFFPRTVMGALYRQSESQESMIHNLGHCDRSAVCSLTQFSLSNVADLG
jgi:hypothetical protein